MRFASRFNLILRQLSILPLLGILILEVSCVSVAIPKPSREISDGVDFVEPKSPYEEIKDESLDKIWKNTRNGNSISFISNCHEQEDIQISRLYKELKGHIDNHKEIKKEFINYNHRRALSAQVKGDIDGVITFVSFVIFKKNRCTYVLSQIALEDTFETDQKYFIKFKEGFLAK